MQSEELNMQIRQARGKFAAMAMAYFLGVFNDNFFKQAILLLAVAAGMTSMQGLAVSLFTLPFLVFAAPAGWLADRFPKRNVVIGAKAAEVVAMTAGAAGICFDSWPLMITMLIIMGTQATVFSPALAGSIPELYPEEYVGRANGLLRMLVTFAILSGIALAGVALDQTGPGWGGISGNRLLVAAVIVGIALAGWMVSLGVVRRPAAAPRTPFPWSGPLQTLRILAECWRDPFLGSAIALDVFIWFAGSLQILIINPLGLQQFKLDATWTSGLIVAQLLGIGIGGLLSNLLIDLRNWPRRTGICGIIMGFFMLGMAFVPGLPAPWQVPLLFVILGAIGIFGGMVLIPVESFVQVRPAPDRKGAVLAAANFVIFAGILLSGPLSNFLNANWLPTTCFSWTGGLAVIFCTLFLIFMRGKEDR